MRPLLMVAHEVQHIIVNWPPQGVDTLSCQHIPQNEEAIPCFFSESVCKDEIWIDIYYISSSQAAFF